MLDSLRAYPPISELGDQLLMCLCWLAYPEATVSTNKRNIKQADAVGKERKYVQQCLSDELLIVPVTGQADSGDERSRGVGVRQIDCQGLRSWC